MAFHTLWILGEQDYCSFRWDFIFIILYFIFCRLLFVRKPRNHWVCNFFLLSIFFWCFHCIYRMFLFIKCVDIYVREIFSRLNLKIIRFQIFHITVCLICKKKGDHFQSLIIFEKCILLCQDMPWELTAYIPSQL